jgi:hypothetical protein
MFRILVTSLILALLAARAVADATIPSGDLPGAKDPGLLKRYEGALIVSYDEKAFDEYLLPIAPLRICSISTRQQSSPSPRQSSPRSRPCCALTRT